jgi:hypothetical protein
MRRDNAVGGKADRLFGQGLAAVEEHAVLGQARRDRTARVHGDNRVATRVGRVSCRDGLEYGRR